MIYRCILISLVVFSACSQEALIPISDRKVTTATDEDKVSDVALQMATGPDSREFRHEDYVIHSLVQTFGPYQSLLLKVFQSDVLEVGLLNEITSEVEWFDKAHKQVEECVLSSTVDFNTLELEDATGPKVALGMAKSDTEVALMCHGNINQNQPLILINTSVFVARAPEPESVFTDVEELDSFKVTVVDTTLMIHVDDVDNPSFALVYQYLEEKSAEMFAMGPKRLKKVYPLKTFIPDTEVQIAEESLVLTNKILEDPLQKDEACSIVPAFLGDETIYVSFRHSFIKQTTLLDGLCGIYFDSSKHYFSAQPSVAAYVEQ